MTETRNRYARVEAARQGDRSAFDLIWFDVHRPVGAAIRRNLELEWAEFTDAGVSEILKQVRTRSFAELREKPNDWSIYGWVAWIAQREVIRFLESKVRDASRPGQRCSANGTMRAGRELTVRSVQPVSG